MGFIDSIYHTSAYIQEKFRKTQVGTVGLVTGSGLGELTSRMEDAVGLKYSDIPNFPVSTVEGHEGTLVIGNLEGVPTVAMNGRVHLYEGFSAQEVTFGTRLMFELGVRTLILTNAAGALNPQFAVGSPMLITDHINFMGSSPLTGKNNEKWGPRFPDMSRVYDPSLQKEALQCALRLGIPLERGVYIGVPGPALETPAETRMYRALGADAIGMSTVPEAIAAHHMGIKVLGLSCLTNKNLPDCIQEVTHEQVLQQAAQSSAAMTKLILELLKNIGLSSD